LVGLLLQLTLLRAGSALADLFMKTVDNTLKISIG